MREADKLSLQLTEVARSNSRQICSAKTLEITRALVVAWQRAMDYQAKLLGTATCPWSEFNKQLVEYQKLQLKDFQEAAAQCEHALGVAPDSPSVVPNRTGAATPYPFDCKKRPIDANVAWYYTCNPAKESAGLKKAAYRHPITPQALYGKAWAECRTRPAGQQHTCIDGAKLQTLLREDANIRSNCGSLSGSQQLACVDRYYLYGPNAGSQKNLRAYYQEVYDHQSRIDEALRKTYNQILDEYYKLDGADPRRAELADKSERYFAALNGEAPVPTEIEESIKTISLSPLSTPQELFDRVARASVDIAIEANIDRLSESDQKECAAAAYRIVWSTLAANDGIKVPDKCNGVVSDAVAQLAYQAAALFDTPPAPEEDLLKQYLALRYGNTGGRMDGTLDAPFEAKGLKPGTDAPN